MHTLYFTVLYLIPCLESLNAKYPERIFFFLSKADTAGTETDRQVLYMYDAHIICVSKCACAACVMDKFMCTYIHLGGGGGGYLFSPSSQNIQEDGKAYTKQLLCTENRAVHHEVMHTCRVP